METKPLKLIFILVLFASNLMGQRDTSRVVNIDDQLTAEDSLLLFNDTMKVYKLDEIMLFNRPKLETYEDRKLYFLTMRRIKKVYPYAVLAAQRLDQLDQRLEKISDPKKKRKYIKIISNYIKQEYEPTLRKFTTTEGKILLKLYYRQTGKNTYETIQKYRSSWKAFWYNAAANIYSLSLKSTYNPFKYKEDFRIESILRELFETKALEEQSPFWEKLNYDDEYFDPLAPGEEEK